MKTILTSFYAKPLAAYLVAAIVAISSFAGPAEAMFLPAAGAGTTDTASCRAVDMTKIQAALETKALQQRLMDYGLSPEETMQKLGSLSDEQVHQLAANMDSLQGGGDIGGTIVGLALIALLVVLIIYLLEGRIEIRRK